MQSNTNGQCLTKRSKGSIRTAVSGEDRSANGRSMTRSSPRRVSLQPIHISDGTPTERETDAAMSTEFHITRGTPERKYHGIPKHRLYVFEIVRDRGSFPHRGKSLDTRFCGPTGDDALVGHRARSCGRTARSGTPTGNVSLRDGPTRQSWKVIRHRDIQNRNDRTGEGRSLGSPPLRQSAALSCEQRGVSRQYERNHDRPHRTAVDDVRHCSGDRVHVNFSIELSNVFATDKEVPVPNSRRRRTGTRSRRVCGRPHATSRCSGRCCRHPVQS